MTNLIKKQEYNVVFNIYGGIKVNMPVIRLNEPLLTKSEIIAICLYELEERDMVLHSSDFDRIEIIEIDGFNYKLGCMLSDNESHDIYTIVCSASGKQYHLLNNINHTLSNPFGSIEELIINNLNDFSVI